MSLTPFSALLQGMASDGEALGVDLSVDWLQGRTAYGGLSAALCVHAAALAFPDHAPLRSAQFAFVGPASGRLTLTPSVLRHGKSNLFVGVDLTGDAGLAVRAMLCFGAARESGLDYLQVPAPAAPDWSDCPTYFKPGTGPGFAAHFDSRLAAGAFPMTPDAPPDMTLWLRHLDPAAGNSLAGRIALADALPPASIILFRDRGPFSTMTWAIDLLGAPPVNESGWWLLRSTAEQAGGGYSTQAMTLWDDQRRPVMLGRQSVAVFV